MNLRHKTAPYSTSPSAPTRWLKGKGYLKGRILDFGCGHGRDCRYLHCGGYDPYWRPKRPKGKYDTVLCTYVFNVIESEKERNQVLKQIGRLLRVGGHAFITVRRDLKRTGYTSTGSFHGIVHLDLKSIHKTKNYEIYEL